MSTAPLVTPLLTLHLWHPTPDTSPKFYIYLGYKNAWHLGLRSFYLLFAGGHVKSHFWSKSHMAWLWQFIMRNEETKWKDVNAKTRKYQRFLENGTFNIKKHIWRSCILAFYLWNIFVLLFFKAVPQGTSTKPLTLSTFRNVYSLKMLPQIFPIQCSCSNPWQLPQGTTVAPHTCATKFPVSKLFFFKATVRQYRCTAAMLSPTTTSQNCYKCKTRNFSIPWLDGFFRRASGRYWRILFYLLIYLLRFSSSYYFYFVIFLFSSSSHLHIFRSSHHLIFPFSYLHIFSFCPLTLLYSFLFPSWPLASCPFIFLSSCLVALFPLALLPSCFLVHWPPF